MALTWSSGSDAEHCQTVAASSTDASTAGLAPLRQTPQSHRLQILAASLHVIIFASLWPVISNSPVLIVLVVTSALVLAFSLFNRPLATAPQHASNHNKIIPTPAHRGDDHHNESAQSHFANTTAFKNSTSLSPITQPQPRRNPAPIHAQIAPLAAPHAGLPTHLNHKDHAWADLMARISHDLRTPLNAVIGFSDLMQKEAFGPLGSPRYQEYAKHIQDCGVALLKSAEDTLAMTSAMSDKPTDDPTHKPIALRPLILDAWQFISTKASLKNVTIQLHLDAGVEVLGDRKALRQVILNLMCEALDHAQENSTLYVQAATDDAHVEIEINATGAQQSFTTDTLPLCVARTLLHLHGTTLMVLNDPKTGWQAKTILNLVGQHDFFKNPEEPHDQTTPTAPLKIAA